ncbi:MAG: hypothetical protein HY430_03480 [Candidatus Levybacteria bacterium]|nr:hypothetical protein [Candidatus Levybacteria bacterium]
MLYLAYAEFGLGMMKKWQLYVFAILAVLPLVLWRFWMVQYPEGIPASDWLFNAGNIRFKGAFFYWLFADRIGRLLLGYWGLALFVIGILANSVNGVVHLRKGRWFFYSFLISALCYMTVIARGNVQHDYYQILILPSIAIFLGIGSAFLLNPPKGVIHILVSRGVLLSCIVFAFLFSWYFVRDYFNINNESFISAGKTADAILPNDARVIALNNGDTSFLYHTNRKGWASFQNDIPSMIDLGAKYMIIANPTENDYSGFGTEYEIVAADHDVLILKLHK